MHEQTLLSHKSSKKQRIDQIIFRTLKNFINHNELQISLQIHKFNCMEVVTYGIETQSSSFEAHIILPILSR